KIELKKKDENIELTSVEISGVVRLIKLSIFNRDGSANVEMNKEEFFNFLSLISAFKDVVIGEDSIIIEEDLNLIQSKVSTTSHTPDMNEEMFNIDDQETGESFNGADEEHLDPEEWDPW
ncbi:MAG: hypothetical protein ACFFAT_17555, partial [Promethearchaeota archaeon]